MRPGYKQTEVGVIPDDWVIATLREISPKQSVGLVINPSSYFDKNGAVPMLVGSNISPNRINWESANRITEESNKRISASRLSTGDIVTVRVGEPGVTAVVPPELDGCNCASVMVVRKGSAFDPHWLCYVMNSQIGISQVENVQYGTAQKQFNISDAVNFVYPFPSLHEQEAIAETLGDADALIESLEQLIAKKRQIKQGAMQELLTGKKRLPGFGGEWAERRFKDLFSFSGGYSASREQLSSEGYCYLHYGDIHTSRKTFIDVRAEYQDIPKLDIPLGDVAPASLLADGDIVFVDASEDDEGTSKHVVVENKDGTPFISGLHTIVAKAKTDELDHLFRRYCFQTSEVKQQFRFFAVGTKVSGVSKTNIVRVKLRVPPVPEQTAIAAILSDMDAELAALEAKLAKARQIKQGMMQELLTGRIRLVDPASNVVPFPAKKESAPAPKKSHNWQFNEAVIIAVLAKKFGSERYPLARKRCTKLTYLLHRHVEREVEGYLKKAAGPYNPATRYKGPEGIAQQRGYVCKRHNGTYEGFVVSDKIAEAEAYFEKWYGSDALTWLEQFHFKKTDELELLATVDMSMEGLRREGKSVGLGTVKQVIGDHPEWQPKLEREIFSDANIARAITECHDLFGN